MMIIKEQVLGARAAMADRGAIFRRLRSASCGVQPHPSLSDAPVAHPSTIQKYFTASRKIFRKISTDSAAIEPRK